MLLWIWNVLSCDCLYITDNQRLQVWSLFENVLKKYRGYREPCLAGGAWREVCTAKWRQGLIGLVVSEIKVVSEFFHSFWPACEIASDSLSLWSLGEKDGHTSQAVWSDWNSVGSGEWVEQTGTCREWSAVSAICYSCTGKPRRWKTVLKKCSVSPKVVLIARLISYSTHCDVSVHPPEHMVVLMRTQAQQMDNVG